jgi:hypothetical protein
MIQRKGNCEKNSNQASVYLQVFFDSLYGTNTNPRLKNMALQFSVLIILGLVVFLISSRLLLLYSVLL